MTSMYYDLEGKEITEIEAIKLFEDKGRFIGRDIVNNKLVSTVWLGIDMNIHGTGRPVIFETMIFSNHGDGQDEYCERYSTIEDALDGHARAVALAEEMKP